MSKWFGGAPDCGHQSVEDLGICEWCGAVQTTVNVVMFSGGIASWAAAKRIGDSDGYGDDLILLFADTLIEDEDVYRFLEEAAANVGGELVRLVEGRDPWQVFFDKRFLGNSRIDPCSEILKRKLMRRWLEEHCDPATTTVSLGYDWTEPQRLARARAFWQPWRMRAPLQEKPYLSKSQLLDWARREGLRLPQLYAEGFPHANCGGFCIKAGQAQFALLLRSHRDRYLYHERREQELREYLGKDVAILRDRIGGSVRPLTLSIFRQRLESGNNCDLLDWGGCGCMEQMV